MPLIISTTCRNSFSSKASSSSSSASSSTSTLVSDTAGASKSFSGSIPSLAPTVQPIPEDGFAATAVGRQAEMMDDEDQAWGPPPSPMKSTASRLSGFFGLQQRNSTS